MANRGVVLLGAGAIAVLSGVLAARMVFERSKNAINEDDAGRKEIEDFNTKFIEAHLKMDNAAVLNLWADDGVSLLPETAPMIGKEAIGKFMEDVTAKMPGYHMEKIDVDFQGVEVNGDWASEWAFEHQIVKAPDDRPSFDGHGKLLLVLHREKDGNWRIKREMWNQGIKP